MTSSDQAVVPHDTSLSSQPGEGLVRHVSTGMRQPTFHHHSLSTKHANELNHHSLSTKHANELNHHSLSTKHANELNVHMDSMFTWSQCSHGVNVQISTNWMLIRQKGKPTSFASLGSLPLLPLLQVDLLEHALPKPFDGRINILGLACLQDTQHNRFTTQTSEQLSCKTCLETCAPRQDLANLLLPIAA